MADNNCDLACLILQRTSDGDDLSPEHLKLVELAVNGFLNEQGQQAFRHLYDQVLAGNYLKPWLQGIESLTIDHEGYVYWKGLHVEHWSGSLPFSNEGKQAAIELFRRCKIIERRGETPDVLNVIWNWEEVPAS